MALQYNSNDKKSLINYAKQLEGNTLREICSEEIASNQYSGKGNFGQILEHYYFGYKPNSKSEADFVNLGIELKSSPLKLLNNKEYRAKERLVLSLIDYLKIVKQDFDSSDFWRKNAHLLLIFYLHESGKNPIDLLIKLVGEWNFPETDLEVIKQDWEIIKSKVVDGKAHELSEGDTFYLGACTKGANANSLRSQPNNDIPAKSRAYSLKQGYVNHIIASIAEESNEVYGKLITSSNQVKQKTIEEIVIEKFQPYYGKNVNEIQSILNVALNSSAKNFYANLTNIILGIELGKKIEEFQKADIEVKTIRLKPNNLPKEDISFPNFRFDEIINEEWDDSDFKHTLENKFFLVFYQFEDDELILRKVKFWNMPYADIQEAKKVWEKTKEIVSRGEIVKEIKNNIRHTNFPGVAFNHVSHVRPHAQNANDTYHLPFNDKLTGADKYTKHCFWLNKYYIMNEIYLK